MKILSSVFTSTANTKFFKNFLKSYLDSQMYVNEGKSLLVIDFSLGNSEIQDVIKEVLTEKDLYHLIYYRQLPGNGFCNNFDFTIDFSKEVNSDIVFFFNDDVVISDVFMSNALKSFERYNNGLIHFVGGTPQIGGWMEDLDNMEMPKPIDKVQFVDPYKKLNWEFSACAFRSEALYRIGYMDHMYSPRIGLNADNDYLIRMKKKFYRCIRDYSMRFLHSKAQTQGKIRKSFEIMLGQDIHTIRAMNYMKLKWGGDTDPHKNYEWYNQPFNGKKVEVLDINTIKIEDEIIGLPEVN